MRGRSDGSDQTRCQDRCRCKAHSGVLKTVLKRSQGESRVLVGATPLLNNVEVIPAGKMGDGPVQEAVKREASLALSNSELCHKRPTSAIRTGLRSFS